MKRLLIALAILCIFPMMNVSCSGDVASSIAQAGAEKLVGNFIEDTFNGTQTEAVQDVLQNKQEELVTTAIDLFMEDESLADLPVKERVQAAVMAAMTKLTESANQAG